MIKKYTSILLALMILSSIVSCSGTTTADTTTQESNSSEVKEEKVAEDTSNDNNSETKELKSLSICGGMITAELPSEWSYDDSNDSMIVARPSGNKADLEVFTVFYGDLGINYSDEDIDGILEGLGNEGLNGGDTDVEIKDYKSEFVNQNGYDTVFKQSYVKDYTPSGHSIRLYSEEYFYPINHDGGLGVMMISYSYNADVEPKYENEFNNIFVPAIKIDNQTNSEKTSDEKGNGGVTFDESVIYDEDGIKAVLTGISDGMYGKNLEITISNDSDKDIYFGVDYIIVNDITLVCAVTNPIPAGKTGNAEYPIDESNLERFGISDIHTLQLSCDISDMETNENTVYCMSEKIVTNLGPDFDLSLPIDDWEVVYESDSLKIYNTGLIEEASEYDEFKSKILLMCFNESDSLIAISPENVSFDGTMDYNNYFSFSIGPESYGEFYLACGEDANEKDEASFSLSVMDGETYENRNNIGNISINLK